MIFNIDKNKYNINDFLLLRRGVRVVYGIGLEMPKEKKKPSD